MSVCQARFPLPDIAIAATHPPPNRRTILMDTVVQFMCLAIPAKIIDLPDADTTRALVEVVGVRRHIDTGLLQDDPPVIGDWVLVHVGFAMSKISEEQAQDQLRMLAMLGEDDAAREEVEGYGLTDTAVPNARPPDRDQDAKVQR